MGEPVESTRAEVSGSGDAGSRRAPASADSPRGASALPGESAAPHRRRPRATRVLRHGVTVLVLVFVVIYFVLPTIATARGKLYVLGTVNPWLLVLAIGLEVASQFAYAKLTMSLLPPNSLPLSTVFRVNLSALAVSHVLPGGTAGGTPVGYRLMTSKGVRGADVGIAAATQGIGSAVVLNAILWLGLIISIPFKGVNSIYVSVAIFGAVLMALFAALVLGFTKGEERATRLFRRIAGRLPWITEDQAEGVIRRIAERLRALGADRRLLGLAVLWAVLNWMLDMAALFACVAAFGAIVNPIYLVVAYGVGNVIAAIPITPGGLGLVETSVPALLKVFGVPYSAALFGVLAWRLVNFWLPIPIGAGAYVSLRVSRGASIRERLGALGHFADRPVGGRRITTPELALENDTVQIRMEQDPGLPALLKPENPLPAAFMPGGSLEHGAESRLEREREAETSRLAGPGAKAGGDSPPGQPA